MRETIAGSGRRPRRHGAGALALGFALLVGPVAGGCGRSAPPAGTETQAGGRREQMANFMKTQKQAGAAASKARRHP